MRPRIFAGKRAPTHTLHFLVFYETLMPPFTAIPAKAGIQWPIIGCVKRTLHILDSARGARKNLSSAQRNPFDICVYWIPAFAGMAMNRWCRRRTLDLFAGKPASKAPRRHRMLRFIFELEGSLVVRTANPTNVRRLPFFSLSLELGISGRNSAPALPFSIAFRA